MATIRIEYEYASGKAEEMKTNADNVEKTLNGLADDVDTNINASTWSGSSAENFKRVWSNSRDEFGQFIQYMKSIQSKVEAANKEAKGLDQRYN